MNQAAERLRTAASDLQQTTAGTAYPRGLSSSRSLREGPPPSDVWSPDSRDGPAHGCYGSWASHDARAAAMSCGASSGTRWPPVTVMWSWIGQDRAMSRCEGNIAPGTASMNNFGTGEVASQSA